MVCLVKNVKWIRLFLQKICDWINIAAFFAKNNSVFVKAFPISGIYYEKLQIDRGNQLEIGLS